ncbi:MAG: lipid II flippase MurJ [Caldilineaceae bacterium]
MDAVEHGRLQRQRTDHGSALNATQHFLLPAARRGLCAAIIVAWLLAPATASTRLVMGVVAGTGSSAGASAGSLPLRPGLHAQPHPARRRCGEVARLMGPRVLGLFFVQMHFLVNTILASRLAAGSLSALNYAWLIMLLPQGVFAQAVSTAAFPTFAAQVAGGHRALMRTTFGRLLRMLLFLMLPAAVGLFVLATPLVTLLLERGEFTARSTQLVVYALRFYALGLVAHGVVEIVVRAFYALHDTLTPVAVGVGAMALNILLSVLLVGPLSFGGLALANSLATSLEMAVLLWLLARRMGGIDGARLLDAVVRNGAAALLMGVTLWWWVRSAGAMLPSGAAGTWWTALGGLVLGMIVYALAAVLVRSRELQPVLALVQRRLPGRRSG